jgi:hypothetical protein
MRTNTKRLSTDRLCSRMYLQTTNEEQNIIYSRLALRASLQLCLCSTASQENGACVRAEAPLADVQSNYLKYFQKNQIWTWFSSILTLQNTLKPWWGLRICQYQLRTPWLRQPAAKRKTEVRRSLLHATVADGFQTDNKTPRVTCRQKSTMSKILLIDWKVGRAKASLTVS